MEHNYIITNRQNLGDCFPTLRSGRNDKFALYKSWKIRNIKSRTLNQAHKIKTTQ